MGICNLRNLFSVPVLAAILAFSPTSYGQQPKWPDPGLLEASIKDAGKKIDLIKDLSKPGPDIEFLQARASDLLKRSTQERENFFKCERLLNATNALLDAAYGLYSSRKTDHVPLDFWNVSRALPGVHFRVQQAGFFANMSGEKNSEQYITLARSVYQQARSAYDAHEYQKAKYLADASWSIVTALESIAQATIPPPKSPGDFKNQ